MKSPVETTLQLSGGKEYRVLYSMLGMIRAEEEYGYDITADRKEGPGALRSMMEDVWLGILTYELVSFEEFALQVVTADDFVAIAETCRVVRAYHFPSKDEDGAEEDAGGQEGNARKGAKKSASKK